MAVDDDDVGDGDDTRGDDGSGGGNNTGDRDSTRGNDGTRGGDNTGDRDSHPRQRRRPRGGDNTGDGDWTGGNDGTAGGDNSYVAPARPGLRRRRGRLRRRRHVIAAAALIAALLLGAGVLCTPAPAAAADPLARVSISVKGEIPDDAEEDRPHGRARRRPHPLQRPHRHRAPRPVLAALPEEVLEPRAARPQGRQPRRLAARHAGRRRLGPVRALQRQGADAQRARLRDGALDGALRGPHALRRGPARRPLPRRLRADGEAQAAEGPDRRARARPAARVDVRLPGAPARATRSGCRSPATTSCSRTPSAPTSAARRRAQIRRSIGAAERAIYHSRPQRLAPPPRRRRGGRLHPRQRAVQEPGRVPREHVPDARRRRALAARPRLGLRHLDGQLRLRPERDAARLDARGSRLGAPALQRPGLRARGDARAGASCAAAGLRRAADGERQAPRAAADGDGRGRGATSAAGRCSACASGPTRRRRSAARATRPRCARCAPGCTAGSPGWTRTWTTCARVDEPAAVS